MIPSSACRQWRADQPGYAGENGDLRRQLHHAGGHDPEKWDAASPCRISRAGGSPISVFIDGAYIRAVPGYQSRPAPHSCRGHNRAFDSCRNAPWLWSFNSLYGWHLRAKGVGSGFVNRSVAANRGHWAMLKQMFTRWAYFGYCLL
jgi:hypothetical protein